MKNYLNKLLFLMFLLSTSLLHGQEVRKYVNGDTKANLAGLWYVACPFEFIDQAAMDLCPFCDADGKGINDSEMTFSRDSILIKQNGITTSVAYSLDYKYVVFSFKNKQYKFRVFYLHYYHAIMEDNEGFLLDMTRQKSK